MQLSGERECVCIETGCPPVHVQLLYEVATVLLLFAELSYCLLCVCVCMCDDLHVEHAVDFGLSY